MNTSPKNHPVSLMRENAQHLREKALFTAKSAQNHAQCARKTSNDIAALDIEGALANVRKMVEMVGGKSRNLRPVQTSNVHQLPLAAE